MSQLADRQPQPDPSAPSVDPTVAGIAATASTDPTPVDPAAEGVEVVKSLVRSADVVIENFKVGGLAKYGLDYASLSAINPRLVRGLDYYRHTAFEFVTDRLGAQGTVLGGGRYDGLIESLGGQPTPAVGS